MKIAITGASGLIGSGLTAWLSTRGHEVLRCVRRNAADASEISWRPAEGNIDTAALEGLDALIHLAGANLADGRWSPEQKRIIRDSRIEGTALIARSLEHVKTRPSVVLTASAIGYYGSRGDEVLTESSSMGRGFLAELCRDWESEMAPIDALGLRRVALRTGLVLSSDGGALAKMLPPFRLGVGGPIGDGQQWMSWIDAHDLNRAVEHILTTDAISGPVNLVSPNPVQNVGFTKSLGHALGRPAVMRVPKTAIKLMFGEMGIETVLASQRVQPTVLMDAGFAFEYPELDAALAHVLARA